MEYNDKVVECFEHPRHVADGKRGPARVGRAGSRRAGAIIEFYLETDEQIVAAATFRAWGCPHTIAVAEWLAGSLPGQRLGELCPLPLERIAAELGLPAEKWHCVLTAEDALLAVLEEH